ncbi:MAG: Fic family protein [Actinobacteria bacterium]|nr:Fic family protein [Actinomycetota bacterium]
MKIIIEKYPHISFLPKWELKEDTVYELGQCDAIIKAIRNIPIRPEYRKVLLNVSLTKGAQSTTAIEGNTLSDEEVEKVNEGIKLPPSKEYQETEVRNILNALNELLREVAIYNKFEIISPDLIKRFNYLVGKDLGDHFQAIPGKIRDCNVNVGTKYRPPDYHDVGPLLKQFCDWSIKEFHFSKGQNFKDSVIQAIISHVYIAWIHPFGDGNGRTARLLEFYILLRAGNPDIASHLLSNFYNETRNEYYRHLEKSTKTGNLSDFLAYAIKGYRDGLNNILELTQVDQFKTSWANYIHEIFRTSKIKSKNENLNKRRRNLILSIPIFKKFTIDEILNLTVDIAATYKILSQRTLTRDLKELINLELLRNEQDKYWANIDLLLSFFPKKLNK